MKNHFLLIALLSFFFPFILVAQLQDVGYYKLPDNVKWAEFGVMGGFRAHAGYINELDSAAIDILKVQYVNNTPKYYNFQLPVNQINYVKIFRAKKDAATGLAIGLGVGTVVGLVAIVARGRNEACNEDKWHPGQLVECANEGLIKVSILGGSVLVGSIAGGIIGTNVSIVIPLNGDQMQYESVKPKLMRYSILRN